MDRYYSTLMPINKSSLGFGRSIFKNAYHLKPGRIRVRVLFDAHAHFAHHANGGQIVIRGRRDNPLQTKLRESKVEQCLGGFCGVSLTLMGWREGVKQAEFRRVEVITCLLVQQRITKAIAQMAQKKAQTHMLR